VKKRTETIFCVVALAISIGAVVFMGAGLWKDKDSFMHAFSRQHAAEQGS
jgi:hypothetical protein